MKEIDHSQNPFRPKAVDRLTPVEIHKLFADPNCYSEVTKIQHQFLLGARGSGKSTLLKRLTISSILQAQEVPPFLGIYFPIKLISVDPYLKIWNETLNSKVFEHYFTLNILRALDIDLSVAKEASDIRNQFESDVRDCLSFLPCSSSLFEDIENHLLHFGSSLSELPQQKLATLTILTELLSKFSSFWQAKWGTELPVALLIDNYQELGPLAFVINNIMRKENLNTLCIKAGTTTTSGLWNQDGTVGPPEYPHDFEIVVVDNDPEDIKTREFLEGVANNRLTPFDSAIDKVFSIFDHYVEISSGNPDYLRKLCEKAWDLARQSTPKKPVSECAIHKDI
jgi:energy-coupling factor transporter ATP-binding protein EcfA2